MPIKKLFNVYLKAETSYNDNTYQSIAASDWLPVYADTVEVSIDSEKVFLPSDTTKVVVETTPLETTRLVKFSWEMPIRVWKDTVVKSSIDVLLKSGLFTGAMPSISVGDSAGSFVLKCQSGQYEIVASGCRITAAEFTGKPGEPLRLKIEGVGLFRSETFSATPLTPTPVFTSIILTKASSVSGEFASYMTDFSVKVEADSHLLKDLTTQFIVAQIIPTTIKISGKISGIAENISTKYVADSMSSTGVTFVGNGNGNTLEFTFASPKVSDRKVKDTDNILYSDLEFVAAGLTLRFNSN